MSAQAAVSEQDAARLGKDLTPIGAEKAASKDGIVPAWDGGMSKVPALWLMATRGSAASRGCVL